MAKKELKPCGTVAAAMRHKRHGEPLCEPCHDALKQHYLKNKANKRARLAEQAKNTPPLKLATQAADLDPQAELLALYELLGQHLQVAPPQSVAGISKERRQILQALTGIGDTNTNTATTTQPRQNIEPDILDELANKRKNRRATS